jgi:TonB family protein
MPTIPAAVPGKVLSPPEPKVGLFASPKPPETLNKQAIPRIQTGRFGSPLGVAAGPNTSPSAVVPIGSFNAAPETNQSAGIARQRVAHSTAFASSDANGISGESGRGGVRSAGFANGLADGTPGGKGTLQGGTVLAAGFGRNEIGGNDTPVAKERKETFVAPEVLAEPRPQYTAEAKQLRIQGEVTLQVKFGANGNVEVLRVVSGLGHGLDEQAERVAQQIQFKPALKNGQPTDHVTYIHILFQLA